MSDQANPDPDFKWPEPTEEELQRLRKELIDKIKQAESGWPTPQPIETAPIPMILHCFHCDEQHIDRGEWATKPHRTHLCELCGLEFRPAHVATVGVDALPPKPEGS